MQNKKIDKYSKNTQQITEENATAIKLIEQGLKYMKDGIDDIKDSVRDLRSELRSNFVTKTEFDNLKDDVDDLKKLKDWGLKIVVGAVIISLLALVGLN